MKDLLNKISEIVKHHEEVAKLSGENFNVFNVIGLTTKEVKLHSRFIAELLNPEGSHGQGVKFLSLFIREINKEKELIDKNFETNGARITVEKNIGKINNDETEGGQIDIVIQDKNGKIIIIENKIYAPDQENQLIRYFNYAKDKNSTLFYLTLFKDEPSEKSIVFKNDKSNDINSKSKAQKLELDKDFFLLSYKEHIISWLKQCRKEAVIQPLLREGITHYINVLKFLTGQSTNENMKNEIINTVTENFKNFKSALNISENINDAKAKIQWQFWEELEKLLNEYLKGKSCNFVSNNNSINSKLVDDYYNKREKINDVGYSILIKSYKNYNVVYSILVDDYVYYAIKLEKDSDFIKLDKKDEIIKTLIANFSGNYDVTDWSIWKYTEPKLNFKEFNTDDVINLADDKQLKETVLQISSQIIEDIEKIEQVIYI